MDWQASLGAGKASVRSCNNTSNISYGGWNIYEDHDELAGAVVTSSDPVVPDKGTPSSLTLSIGALKSQSGVVSKTTSVVGNRGGKIAEVKAPTIRKTVSAVGTGPVDNGDAVSRQRLLYRDKRLPQLVLATKLEEIVLVLWRRKGAYNFNTVDYSRRATICNSIYSMFYRGSTVSVPCR